MGAALKPRSGLGRIAADPLNRAAVADFKLPPASIAGLTPDYFDAALNSSTGKTQYRYHIERRIYYVKELLRHVSASVAEVACGGPKPLSADDLQQQSPYFANSVRDGGVFPRVLITIGGLESQVLGVTPKSWGPH